MSVSQASIPRRILMTADTVGGVWTYALSLIAALPSTEFALVTMGRALSADQWTAAWRLDNLTIHETEYRLEWMDEPWADVDASGERLLELEAMLSPDVVHLNGYAHGALAWRSPVLVVAHSCVLSWWEAVRSEPAPARYGEYRKRVSEGLCCAGAVAAPTRAMLAALRRHYPMAHEGVTIYNGVPARDIAFGSRKPRIIAAGRLWDDGKNFAVLDEAARGLDWEVALAGDGGGSGAPFRHLKYLGNLPADELQARLAEASIFAHPARYEPFGLAVAEAARCGCALVLADIPSLRELWEGAAVFVPPDQPGPWHDALSCLAASPDRRCELGKRARERVRRYSMEAMARGYLNVYARLMTARGSATPRR